MSAGASAAADRRHVRLRPAGPADAAALTELDGQCFEERAWNSRQWAQELSPDPIRRYVVAVEPRLEGGGPEGGGSESGGIVGYAGILLSGSAADVLTLGVAPRMRGRGIAGLLLDELLDLARKNAAADMFLEVDTANGAAKALYTGRGFRELAIRRHYYGPEQHAVTMRRELRPPWGAAPFGSDAP